MIYIYYILYIQHFPVAKTYMTIYSSFSTIVFFPGFHCDPMVISVPQHPADPAASIKSTKHGADPNSYGQSIYPTFGDNHFPY